MSATNYDNRRIVTCAAARGFFSKIRQPLVRRRWKWNICSARSIEMIPANWNGRECEQQGETWPIRMLMVLGGQYHRCYLFNNRIRLDFFWLLSRFVCVCVDSKWNAQPLLCIWVLGGVRYSCTLHGRHHVYCDQFIISAKCFCNEKVIIMLCTIVMEMMTQFY